MEIESELSCSDIDGFIIMDNGVESFSSIHKDILSRITFYHFYSPTYQDGIPREYIPQIYFAFEECGIREKNFQKRGKCLLIDDAVFRGRTLARAASYVMQLGYAIPEIFIFARDIRYTRPEWNGDTLSISPPFTLSHISFYKELLPGIFQK